MTEIKIEKKKPVWPWILLILIILGIVAYFVYAEGGIDDFQDDGTDDVYNEKVMDTSHLSSSNRSLQNADGTYGSSYDSYSAFAGSITDSTRIAVDSSYTKRAFANLAKVVVKKADENDVADSPALTDLRAFSVLIIGISKTSTRIENVKNFKTACDKVAKVLGDIQEKSYPSLKEDASQINQMAADISPSVSMADQQHKMTAFLHKTRDILQAMNP